LDVEFQESQSPVLYLFRRLMNDNHGFGKYRGGAGVQFGVMLHNVKQYTAIARGQGSKFPIDAGLFGGFYAGTGPAISVRDTNLGELLAKSDPKLPYDVQALLTERPIRGEYQITEPNMYWTMKEGDLIVNYSSSGAGYGDPLEREPELVMRDLREGLLSHETASEVYAVVYDRETYAVDHEATDRRRMEERKVRLNRGQPYAEFEREWSKKRPMPEILLDFGPWP